MHPGQALTPIKMSNTEFPRSKLAQLRQEGGAPMWPLLTHVSIIIPTLLSLSLPSFVSPSLLPVSISQFLQTRVQWQWAACSSYPIAILSDAVIICFALSRRSRSKPSYANLTGPESLTSLLKISSETTSLPSILLHPRARTTSKKFVVCIHVNITSWTKSNRGKGDRPCHSRPTDAAQIRYIRLSSPKLVEHISRVRKRVRHYIGRNKTGTFNTSILPDEIQSA